VRERKEKNAGREGWRESKRGRIDEWERDKERAGQRKKEREKEKERERVEREREYVERERGERESERVERERLREREIESETRVCVSRRQHNEAMSARESDSE